MNLEFLDSLPWFSSWNLDIVQQTILYFIIPLILPLIWFLSEVTPVTASFLPSSTKFVRVSLLLGIFLVIGAFDTFLHQSSPLLDTLSFINYQFPVFDKFDCLNKPPIKLSVFDRSENINFLKSCTVMWNLLTQTYSLENLNQIFATHLNFFGNYFIYKLGLITYYKFDQIALKLEIAFQKKILFSMLNLNLFSLNKMFF